jgi:hypothetical protein
LIYLLLCFVTKKIRLFSRNRVGSLTIPPYLETPLRLTDASRASFEFYLYIGAEIEMRDFFYENGGLWMDALPVVHTLPTVFYEAYMHLLRRYSEETAPHINLIDELDRILAEMDGNRLLEIAQDINDTIQNPTLDDLVDDLAFEFPTQDEAIDFAVSPLDSFLNDD